jgi:molybdopterin-guanine dinucleotide biosynthesis protein A
MTDGAIAAVILAGGQARRMGGGDKGLRTVGGVTILARVIERMRPQVAAMVLNANGDPARFAPFGLPVVEDAVPGHQGPLAGILAGLHWAVCVPHIIAVVSVPSDTPFLPVDLVARLRGAAATPTGCLSRAASGGWAHPVVGLWPLSILPFMRDALAAGVTKVDAFTAGHTMRTVEWRTDPLDPFFNANSPDDLARAEVLAAAAAARQSAVTPALPRA